MKFLKDAIIQKGFNACYTSVRMVKLFNLFLVYIMMGYGILAVLRKWSRRFFKGNNIVYKYDSLLLHPPNRPRLS